MRPNGAILRLDKNGYLLVVDSSHEGWQCSNNRLLEFEKATLLPSASRDFFCGAVDSAYTDPRKPWCVCGPANMTTRGAGEGGPDRIPNHSLLHLVRRTEPHDLDG